MRQHYNKNNSEVDFWTPRDLFHNLELRYGPFDMDVAASAENALCLEYIDKEQNALCDSVEWGVRSWCNPPYDDIGPWVSKAIRHTRGKKNRVVMLLPARTCTKWFQLAWEYATQIEFISGRVNFGGPHIIEGASGAPFPSLVVVFENKRTISPRTHLICRLGAPLNSGRQSFLEDF
jgi:phage N-6-adenine-methyltransferase